MSCAISHVVSLTAQTRSRQRLLPATMMCCQSTPVPWLPALPSAVILAVQLRPVAGRPLGQYSAERPNRRHSTSCMDKINSSLLCCFQTGSRVHLASSPGGTRNFFLGGKETDREAKRKPLCTARLKVRGAVPPLPYTSLWHDA